MQSLIAGNCFFYILVFAKVSKKIQTTKPELPLSLFFVYFKTNFVDFESF